jgi:hypothetical protein
MKIAINTCHGSFNLSDKGLQLYKERAGVVENLEDSRLVAWDIPRDDENLVSVIEELGEKCWGQYSALKVVEIPDDVEWQIEEYDGVEWIAEKHRIWN